MKTVFLRVLEADDKATALLDAVRDPARAQGRQRFEVHTTSFASVPRSPFAYWVSERLRSRFQVLPALQADGRVAAIGASTKDDGRFLRACWEVPPGAHGNVPIAKGGLFSPYYADVHLSIRWRDDGAEVKTFVSDYRAAHGWSPHWKAELHNPHLYFRPGLTWPRRTNGLSFRAMPAGCIFADKGPAVFLENDHSDSLFAFAALANSRAFGLLVSLQLARTELAQSFEVGLIQTTPVPNLTDPDRESLARLARRAWSLKRSLDARTQTSHAFTLPALLQVAGTDLAACAATWSEHVLTVEAELVAIQAEIDERCFALYGIDEADRCTITEGFCAPGSPEVSSDDSNDTEEDDIGEKTDENESTANATSLATGLLSWAVGVAFGRFDICFATGKRPLPAEPEPFDPFPVCSPAMLTGDDGLPVMSAPVGYPVLFPENGILVDDPGHTLDLTASVRVIFDEVFKTSADAWWNEVAALLDPKDQDLRAWIAASFFEHHLKVHSKSRRKAPVIWQFAAPSGRYSVWLYAHRLTRDSFFQIQNDVVIPKLAHEERQLAAMAQKAGLNPSATDRKDIAVQESLIEELRAMLDEVKRVAPLWNPMLDDGVALTMAPLWRLLPQHKHWQRELKTTWDALCRGDCDWAHVAMHLWPERVVPKCATDRSLAIAHGLENISWIEGDDGKWMPRSTPTRSVEELVRERTSIAVKAALKSLLEAPVAKGNGGRGRGRKAAHAAVEVGAR
jgi:hypothetical protein